VADAPTLPESHTDGDASHTAGHNDTNRSVNALKVAYDAHAAEGIGVAHGGGVAASVFDAKGEILAGTGDNTYDTLSPAADGNLVGYDSSTPSGLTSFNLATLLTGLGVGTGTQTVIQDEGVALPARGAVDFVGTAVSVVDDAGNDRVIVTVSTNTNTVNLTRVTTAQSVTSSTTLVDASNLSQSVGAGEIWEASGLLAFRGDPAADVRVTMIAPTGSTQVGRLSGLGTAATGSTSIPENGGLIGATPSVRHIGTLSSTPGAEVPVYVKSLLIVGGTAGTWKVQWAQDVSNATASVLIAGSYITFSRVS
jgi:hypothetical protein